MIGVHFRRDALFLIAGPCVLEDDALNLRVGEHLARLAEHVPGGIIFKASFDKANRSNAGAFRGPGLQEGLAALARVRSATASNESPASGSARAVRLSVRITRSTPMESALGATSDASEVRAERCASIPSTRSVAYRAASSFRRRWLYPDRSPAASR